ncbi:MAG: CvpA family protein [Candidatus Aminicenantes bacterium]|nr:CvpA family protein [Candidatus Aminicenantes bacterium]
MNLDLNILDFAFLIIMVLSVFFGIWKGLIRELFSLAFFIIAVVLSFLYYFEAGNMFLKQIKSRDVANFVGFLLIFVSIVIVGSLVTYFIKRVFIIGPLKSIDRILGGVFGLLRGILISAILVFGLISFPIDEKLVLESKLSPVVIKTINVFFNLLPEKFKQKLKLFKENDRQKNNRTGRKV